MCRRVAEGTKWGKCGHFQRQFVSAIEDCASARCEHSLSHPRSCRDKNCIPNFGPDIQKVVDKVDDYCFQCRVAAARTLPT